MVHISVNGKKVTIEVRDNSIIRNYDDFGDSLIFLVVDNSYKLERYETERDLTNLSNKPLCLKAWYEDEFLSNSVAKLVELWIGTRGIEVELDK